MTIEVVSKRQVISIQQRFNGPPGMGNGGYVSGLVGQAIKGGAEVTLRRPSPLNTPLTLEELPDNRVVLMNGDELLVEARSAWLELNVPAAPSYQQSLKARENYELFNKHPFGSCFVCGPERKADGLRIFPGPLNSRKIRTVATVWTPGEDLSDEIWRVRPEFVWAALDCPGAIAFMNASFLPLVLGQFTVELERDIWAGERYIVMGWQISQSGRKYVAGSAIYTATGKLCAKAKATWFQVDWLK